MVNVAAPVVNVSVVPGQQTPPIVTVPSANLRPTGLRAVGAKASGATAEADRKFSELLSPPNRRSEVKKRVEIFIRFFHPEDQMEKHSPEHQ